MMNWNKQTINEWNELGFYYEYEENFNQWRFFGSKQGIKRFSYLIDAYANKNFNNNISEHIHIGPYSYLKIMTWHEPVISKDYIAGSLINLKALSILINNKLHSSTEGSIFKVSDEYAKGYTASLVFFVMDNDFKPSSIEF